MIKSISNNLKGYLISCIVLEFLIIVTYLKWRDIFMLLCSMIIGPIVIFIGMIVILILFKLKK